MEILINSIKQNLCSGGERPFSVYNSVYEQKLLNVPITRPTLVVVLSGDKQLGPDHEILCHAGQFIFLSDSPAINMRNIPRDNAYFALIIEFDYQDFTDIPLANTQHKPEFILGELAVELQHCLQQFVESSAWAPQRLWSLRKKEILMLLYDLGYSDVVSMMGKPKVSHRLHDLFHELCFQDVTLEVICDRLSMSESTLRRKLKSEGTQVQEVKDRARLGLGLHLLQTTEDSIGLVAEACGYSSQSRFTDRFKGHFGLTPSELRKTLMTD